MFCSGNVDSDIYNNITIINHKNYDKNLSYALSNFEFKFVYVGKSFCAIDICIDDQSYLFFKKSNLSYSEIYGLQYEYFEKPIALCVDLTKKDYALCEIA